MTAESPIIGGKDTILARQIYSGLQERFPTNEKERQIAAELQRTGVYQGSFSKSEFERSIAQIAWVVMKKDGEDIIKKYRSIPFIGHLFSGSFLHNITESQIVVPSSEEVQAFVETHIHSPITGFVGFSYYLINQGDQITCDMERVKITKNAEGLNAKALSRIKMAPMFQRHMSDIPSLVEDTLRVPLHAEGIRNEIKVNRLHLNPKVNDKLLEVDLQII